MPKEVILASSLVSAKIHLRFVARAILERNEIVGDTAPRSTLAILGCCVPIIDANFFWDKFSSIRTPSISNPMFIFSSIYVQLSEGGVSKTDLSLNFSPILSFQFIDTLNEIVILDLMLV